jgi:hypothetical protein
VLGAGPFREEGRVANIVRFMGLDEKSIAEGHK